MALSITILVVLSCFLLTILESPIECAPGKRPAPSPSSPFSQNGDSDASISASSPSSSSPSTQASSALSASCSSTTKTPVKYLPCDICHKLWANEYRFKRHRLSCQPGEPFTCPLCGSTHTTKDALRVHESEKPHRDRLSKVCSIAQCIEGDGNTIVAALTPALAASGHEEDTQQTNSGSQVSSPAPAVEQEEWLVEPSSGDLSESEVVPARPGYRGNDGEADDDEQWLTEPVPSVGDLPIGDTSISPSPSRSPSPLLQLVPEPGRARDFSQPSFGSWSMLASISQADRRDYLEVLQLSSLLVELRVSDSEDQKPPRLEL